MKKLILLGLLAFSAFGIAEPYRDERGVLFMSEEEWVRFYNKDGQDVDSNWIYDHGRKLYKRWQKNATYFN